MNDVLNSEIEKRVEQLTGDLPVAQVSRQRVQHLMNELAQIAATIGAENALMSLRTIDDAIALYGGNRATMRRIARNRHERFGIGAKIGGVWLFTENELQHLEPDRTRRPKSTGPDSG